jgi:hypothetical protein
MARTGFAWLAAAVFAAVAPAQDPSSDEGTNPFPPFDRAAFEKHVRGLGASDADIAAFRSQCEDESEAYASEALLRKLVTQYDAAAAYAENSDPKAALELATLISGDDAFVRAHSRYHLGRVFLDADDPEKAVDVFAEFLRQDRGRTALDSEVAFFYATALAEIPAPGAAAAAFGDYLQLFADAPERFRAVAMQRKAELEDQFQNPLHEIADDMKGVGRKLKKVETGKPTQEIQEDIVVRLEKIIEEMEERESQSGAPSGNSQSSNPAANSALPGGASRVGDLGKMPGVADRWGDMKDQERKAIETDVQTKLPPHYRKLLQDYYDKLGRGPSRDRR